jgi:alpha-1,3-rhamnosyl/mannosyltransferase
VSKGEILRETLGKAFQHDARKEEVLALRVIFNQLPCSGKKTGIGHYSAQLFHQLRKQAGSDQITGFPGPCMRQARMVWSRMYPYLERGIQNWPPDGTILSWPWRQTGLQALRGLGRSLMARHARKVFGSGKFDLYHEPNFLPLPNDFPTVATFHDLSVLLHPEWHPADRVAHFEHHLPRTLAQCVHFLTVSEFSRQEVIRTLDVPPERVTKIHNGIRDGLRPLPPQEVQRVLRRLGLPPRYLLYLGTLEPRKNVLRLLQAYCALPARLRTEWPLLLVGGWGWKFIDIADYLHREARHRGVIHLGYVADRYVAAIYNGARALLYPSLYEGFGLPPLEMMACGGAVLTSTAGALVETSGGRSHLLPPDDVLQWRDAMARLLRDEDWWRSLRQGVEEAVRPYSWENCARQTWQVYRRLGDAHASGAAALAGAADALPAAA